MQSTITQRLAGMYDLLLTHFGPQNWWPGDTEFEVMVGAVLTQNTNWKNVEKAIKNLKESDLLSLERIRGAPLHELAERIRPAGYFNVKAQRLKNLIDFIVLRYDSDLDLFLKDRTKTLREGLLSVKGIGPETADSMILYAAGRPIFVTDAYTYRILKRHGEIDGPVTYDELQALFMDHLPEDSDLFNEFHALIVRTGKEYCRKKPLCSPCPLNRWGRMLPDYQGGKTEREP